MKFALNGALTLGTLDGANVEILDNVGKDHIFIFGNTVEQVEALRREGYRPFDYYQMTSSYVTSLTKSFVVISHRKNRTVITLLFKVYNTTIIINPFADFRSYVEAQKAVDKKYQDRDAWIASTIQNMVNMGLLLIRPYDS